jgi:hypothetical protein
MPAQQPSTASFLTIPPSQAQLSTTLQHNFIAQNNMLHAQAAVAQAAGTVPVSIMQLGARGRPATTILGHPPAVNMGPIPRASESAGTPKDEDIEWQEYFNAEGR